MSLKNILPLVVCLICFKHACFSQNKMLENTFTKNTIEIYNGENNEQGSGLIIGKQDGKIMILTAKHVVGTKPIVDVRLEKYQNFRSATVEHTSDFYDLALLTVNADSFQWQPYTYVSNLIPGDSIFIISAHRDKVIVPSDGSGVANDMDKTNIIVKVRGIIPGDSGTPLWTSAGVVGIIYTRSPVQALPIALIKQIITEEWEVNWQLIEVPIYRPVVDKTPPPDFNDIPIPIYSVSIEGECKDRLNNLIDNNVNTSWYCKTEGEQTITIHLSKTESVRKIKIYDNGEDIPAGSIEIPGSKLKISLRGMSNYLDNDKNGKWYVYDFGKFYQTNQIKLSVKVRHDWGTTNVIEVYISEIKVTGLKTD